MARKTKRAAAATATRKFKLRLHRKRSTRVSAGRTDSVAVATVDPNGREVVVQIAVGDVVDPSELCFRARLAAGHDERSARAGLDELRWMSSGTQGGAS